MSGAWLRRKVRHLWEGGPHRLTMYFATPELEQLAMDPRRSPQRIFRAHLPDQRSQLRVDLRPASKRAGFPTPVPTEASSMPTHEGLGPDDRDGLEDRWKPSIQQDQEQAISVRELDTTAHPPLQHNQLMTAPRSLPQVGSST